MYNKLFTKILDSSIWLEPTPIRIVWVTFLAVMDQDGVVMLSGEGNVAARARVTEQEAHDAIKCLESPDDRNPGQDNDGRRIERIPGVGWLVLNAKKYRSMFKAEIVREQTRQRVSKHRCNANVTHSNENVTPAIAISNAISNENIPPTPKGAKFDPLNIELPFRTESFRIGWTEWVEHRREIGHPLKPKGCKMQLKDCAEWGEARALAAFKNSIPAGYMKLVEPYGNGAKAHDSHLRPEERRQPVKEKPWESMCSTKGCMAPDEEVIEHPEHKYLICHKCYALEVKHAENTN